MDNTGHNSPGTFLVAIGYFLAVFGATWLVVDLPLDPQPWGLLVSSLAMVFATGAVVAAAGRLGWEQVPGWGLLVGVILAGLLDAWSIRAGLPLPSSLAVLLGAIFIGVLLARYVFFEPEVLLLICTLYIIVDLYSVYLGPTGAIVERGGPMLATLTVHFPIVGTGRVLPLIGVTDFAVWSACLLAARRFSFDYGRSFLAIAGALLATSVIGTVAAQAVPALPLMMIAYLLVNRRHFQFRQRDLWVAGAGVLVVVLAVGALLRWLLTR